MIQAEKSSTTFTRIIEHNVSVLLLQKQFDQAKHYLILARILLAFFEGNDHFHFPKGDKFIRI